MPRRQMKPSLTGTKCGWYFKGRVILRWRPRLDGMMSASLARRRQAAARPAARRRAAQRQRVLRDDMVPRWKYCSMQRASFVLRARPSCALPPCPPATRQPPRPARSCLPRRTAARSCGGRVAESALLTAPDWPNRAGH